MADAKDELVARRPKSAPTAPALQRKLAEWAATHAAAFTDAGDPLCFDCGGPAKRDGRHLCETCEGKR